MNINKNNANIIIQNDGDEQSSISLENYQIQSILGQGSSGTVYLALETAHNRLVALKEVKIKESINSKQYKEVINEVEVMKKINHPNIIKLYDSFIDSQLNNGMVKKQNMQDSYQSKDQNQINQLKTQKGTSLYISMEYAELGDMQSLINDQKSKRKYFSEKEIWQVAWQLCLALLHCHSHDIIHRDIKPLNVLVTADRIFKLGDLSESIMVTKERYLKSKTVGTPLYLSPEIIKKQQYDHRTDIFSLGVVMYHMAALEVPWFDKNLDGLMNKILYKQPLPFQVAYSNQLKEFVFGMLEKDKSKRAFVIDLFQQFPKNYFRITNKEDEENFEVYSQFKDAMDRKRAIDGNKHKIAEKYDVLKKRFQDNIIEQQKQRAENNRQSKMNYLQQTSRIKGNMYEQIEKDELLKHRRFQAAKRMSSKLEEEIKEKSPSPNFKPIETALNRENLIRFEQEQELMQDDKDSYKQSRYKNYEEEQPRNEYQTPHKRAPKRQGSSKGAVTTSYKNKIKYGISAFKDSGEVNLSVSKTDIFGNRRQASPTVIQYGLDQVTEENEIPAGTLTGNIKKRSSELNVAAQEKIESLRVVKIIKNENINYNQSVPSDNRIYKLRTTQLKVKADDKQLPDIPSSVGSLPLSPSMTPSKTQAVDSRYLSPQKRAITVNKGNFQKMNLIGANTSSIVDKTIDVEFLYKSTDTRKNDAIQVRAQRNRSHLIETNQAFRDDGCPEIKSPLAIKEGDDYQLMPNSKMSFTEKKKNQIITDKFLNRSIQHAEKSSTRNVTPSKKREMRGTSQDFYQQSLKTASHQFFNPGSKKYDVQLPQIGFQKKKLESNLPPDLIKNIEGGSSIPDFKHEIKLIEPINRVQILPFGDQNSAMLSNKKRQLKTVRTIHHLRGESLKQ